MNATEHIDYLAERHASALPGTLRAAMYAREGVATTDDAIRRGLSAFAVERTGMGRRRSQTTMVFGRSRSDALRRASAPARLGEEVGDEESCAALIASGWDEPITWPVAA